MTLRILPLLNCGGRFKSERTKTLQAALVNYYTPVVRKIALRLYVQYRHDPDYKGFEIEDFVKEGISWLADIITNFKQERDGEFEDYWIPKIHRLILVGLLDGKERNESVEKWLGHFRDKPPDF
jgi:DNA-directed RNA polymerase specialized sigma subunit